MMHTFRCRGRAVLVGLLAMVWVSPAPAGTAAVEGQARAVDGDTLVVDGREFDLFGIVAPRFNQQCQLDRLSWSCGREAARALDRLVRGRPIHCEPREPMPPYGATVLCTVGGADVADAMVQRGFAVAWKAVEPYWTSEQVARALALGIWRDGDIDPWLWRPEGD
jgi:endonuclease YncB( thermonuclease family)